MLISGHIFIMPQRRFKFKLCRLACGERSLDSLPIIQLLLPSPFLFLSLFLPLPFVLVSISVVYFLRSSLARVNCGPLPFFLSSLPLWKFSRKSFTLLPHIYESFSFQSFLCFSFSYLWLEDFSDDFQFLLLQVSFEDTEEGYAVKKQSPIFCSQ